VGVTVPHTPVAPACPPQVPDTQRCCTRGGSRDGTRTGASASSPPRTRAGRTPQPPMALFPPSFPGGDTLLTPHCASTPPTQAQGPRRCFRQSHHTLIFSFKREHRGSCFGLSQAAKREVSAHMGQGRNLLQVFSRRLEHTTLPPLVGRPRIDRINPTKTRGFFGS